MTSIKRAHYRDHKDKTRNQQGRAGALRGAREAAAYNPWLAVEIQASLDDSRPSIPHEEVMAEMDTDITALARNKRA